MTAIILGGAIIAGCQNGGTSGSSSAAYEISKDGIVVESNKNTFDALGDTTFTRTQNFKIRRVDGSKNPRSSILVVKLVVKVGGKDVSENFGDVIVDKGEGKLECQHYYDVKTEKLDDSPDPVCEITVLGEVDIHPTTAVIK